MSDYSELKRVASLAKNWSGEIGEDEWYTACCFDKPKFSVPDAEFIAKCDPGLVLALIAEVEGLRCDVRAAEKESERLQEINRIAGDEMRAFQQAARTDREDTVRAVAHADALSDQLSEAHRTICSQGSKIQAQQLAIGELYMRAIF